MRRRTAFALVPVLTLAWIVAGTSPASAEVEEPKESQVTMSAVSGFSPASLAISTGTTVVWRNDDLVEYPVVGASHKLRASDASFESDVIPRGQSWSTTFLAPGTISYVCTLHPTTMTGELVITGPVITPEAAPKNVAIVEPDSTDQTRSYFDPNELIIDVGTTVTWRNQGAATHTVTADDATFDSGYLSSGKKWSFTFTKPSSISYKCEPHPWMTGLIRVREPGQEPPPPPPVKKDTEPVGRAVKPAATPVERSDGTTTYKIQVVDSGAPLEWSFTPAQIEARSGDTVVWSNTGSVEHTVTADDGSFDSGMLKAGAIFSRTFEDAAVIRFHCTPHPWMKGIIVVAAASGIRPVVPPPSATQPGLSGDSGAGPTISRPADTTTRTLAGPPLVTAAGADRDRTMLIIMAAMLLLGAATGVAGGREFFPRS